MKDIIDLFLMFFDLPPVHYKNDGWLEDFEAKCGHLLLHAGVAFLCVWQMGWWGVAFSAFWTLSFGTQYELYDSARGVGFSVPDWLTNWLGWLAGVICGMIVGG